MAGSTGSEYLSRLCFATTEGVSLLGISEAAERLGLHTVCGRVGLEQAGESSAAMHIALEPKPLRCALPRGGGGRRYYIADPGKGLVVRSAKDMEEHWVSTRSGEEDRGVAMFIETTPAFYTHGDDDTQGESRSLGFLLGYVKKYRRYFGQIAVGLLLGCLLQLVLPFLTQAVVDVGIKNKDIGFVWLVLLGQLVLTLSRTALDFIRRWLLLHISMRVNISLVSDFFIKLLRLPMSFFRHKGDGRPAAAHGRPPEGKQAFLTGQTLGVMFSMLSLVVFGVVLLMYRLADICHIRPWQRTLRRVDIGVHETPEGS